MFSHFSHITCHVSHAVQEAVTISNKNYCQQDQSLRTFLHDIAAAVPVCVVLPPEAWQPLRCLMQSRLFSTAGARSSLKVTHIMLSSVDCMPV